MVCSIFRKNILLILLLILGIGNLKAQESSLLWKVSGNGLEKESYLFGTIHLICKDDFLMNDRILKALGNSEKLVMELDMSDPQLQTKLQQVSMNPGMKNIQSELNPDDAKILDEFLTKNYGAGLAQLGILKPFVLSTMALMKTIPCEEIESYEGFFTSKASESNKPVMGLETPEFQVGIFDHIPIEVQIGELVKMLNEDSGKEDFNEMTEIYLAEDIWGLYEMMNSEGMIADYRGLILDNRNKAWVSILEEEMKSQSLFVAVGGGHLGGENGVIALLQNAGYQVDPIKK
ncbi:MAG TPA: TraB/GumN family protein [Algoriphagus sp.]|nr:TraB/GumN family protein [Algoriphagus sp.]